MGEPVIISVAGETWDHGGGPLLEGGIDASMTLNPLGPSFSLFQFLRDNEKRLGFYPDPFSLTVAGVLSERTSVLPERILPGPGSTALLYRLFACLKPPRVLLPLPIFSEYPRAGRAFDIPVCPIDSGDSRPECLWPIDPGFDRTLKLARKGDLVVLVNPVNPTGEEFSREKLLDFFARLRHRGASLLVDESFQDFIGERSSLLDLVGNGSRGLFVLKSFTKRTGIAGLRTGALFGEEDVLSRVRREMGPWSTGTLEQEMMRSMCQDEDRFRAQCDEIERLRGALSGILFSAGMPVLAGSGPFLMARTGWGVRAEGNARRILESFGVRLRIATGFGPGNGEDWVRIGYQGFLEPKRTVSAIASIS